MPDKEESYITVSDNVVCTSNYQSLALSREVLHCEIKKDISLSSHMEESSLHACHTAFPVDLKEVFELTNPNSEIHQTVLRSSDEVSHVALQYAHASQVLRSPKHSEDVSSNEVTWRQILRDQGRHPTDLSNSPPEDRNWDSVIEEPQNLNISDGSEIVRSSKSQLGIISSQEPWTHVIKQTGEVDKQLSHCADKEQHEILSSDDHGNWSRVMEEMSNNPEISHASQVINSHADATSVINAHQQWTHVLTESPNHHDIANVPPIDLSSDCSKLNNLEPKRRDVSCQVDDLSCQGSPEDLHVIADADTQNANCSESLDKHGVNSSEDIPQSMINLSIASEAPCTSSQLVVQNGIKPELYTQEKHLVVQAGRKAEVVTKTASTFPCNHCGKVFGDSRSLQRHLLIHVGLRPYRCPVCGKAFMLNGDLTRHIRIHSGEKPYVCDICGRRFTLKGNLMQHFRTHTPEKQYACKICDKNYAQKDSLHRHIRAHFGEKPFECTTCGKKFTLKGDLSRHILIHSGVKPHSCKLCGRQFALKGNLTQHVRTHIKSQNKDSEAQSSSLIKEQSEPQLICDLSYSFVPKIYTSVPNSTSNLKLPHLNSSSQSTNLISSHSFVQNSSPSENSHQSNSVGLSFCSECSKTFPSPESLHEHVQHIHEQSTRLASNRYLCNICQKEFCLKGDLTRHLNSHNGVKPYECEHCNKSFTLKSNLRQHLTTHQVDKNFACPMCSKSFGNRRNLNLHLRRHEQARANFTCTKCGRSFLAKSDHFFHDCFKEDASPSADKDFCPPLPASDIINNNTPPTSPENNTECSIPVSIEISPEQTSAVPLTVFSVKREMCNSPCDDRELDDLDGSSVGLAAVNGGQTFLGPFYRHLYFSTSHSAMIPSIKNLLQTSIAENTLNDFNKSAKS